MAMEWVLITWLMVPGSVPKFTPMGSQEACERTAAAMDAMVRVNDGDPASGGVAFAPVIDGTTGLKVHMSLRTGLVYLCIEREAAPGGTTPAAVPPAVVCLPPRPGDKPRCLPVG